MLYNVTNYSADPAILLHTLWIHVFEGTLQFTYVLSKESIFHIWEIKAWALVLLLNPTLSLTEMNPVTLVKKSEDTPHMMLYPEEYYPVSTYCFFL